MQRITEAYFDATLEANFCNALGEPLQKAAGNMSDGISELRAVHACAKADVLIESLDAAVNRNGPFDRTDTPTLVKVAERINDVLFHKLDGTLVRSLLGAYDYLHCLHHRQPEGSDKHEAWPCIRSTFTCATLNSAESQSRAFWAVALVYKLARFGA